MEENNLSPEEATVDEASDPGVAPRGVLAALDELLRRPAAIFARSEHDGRSSLPYLFLGALFCCLLYGAASGLFQGGSQILVAAFKAPLIVFGSLLLCLPSFYVLSSLAGVEVSPRWLGATLIGLGGILGLLLVALMPISWLFSVSSASLTFVVVLHFCVWFVALYFGHRFLKVALRARGEARHALAWLLLFWIVSLQVASQLRPVLWRPADMEIFAPEKMFFLEHYGRIADGKEGKSDSG